MTSVNRMLMMVAVVSVCIWGCARGPGIGNSSERIRGLESRIAKLEGDFRAAATARDHLRLQLAAVENQRLQLQTERDALQQQVTARTNERDTVQAQYELLRKGIRNLLHQVETAAGNEPAATCVATTAKAEKS